MHFQYAIIVDEAFSNIARTSHVLLVEQYSCKIVEPEACEFSLHRDIRSIFREGLHSLR